MGCTGAKAADVSSAQAKKTITQDPTSAEFEAQIRKFFDEADINRNGVLELEEFKQFSLNILEALHNHPLGSKEDDVHDLFGKLDKNKDGVLQWEEVWSSFENMSARCRKE